ncbi:CLUMA_CG002748, isoform A [Clunio marinus]|uniref:CLUMA_CG002748, isoform A n=1 Tax=Clunio marinus TaxID=568069 RepID=A0A1J1HNN4_9DIPT|nr:CLUMA_CG002748, isoform A [Clunio marinus]
MKASENKKEHKAFTPTQALCVCILTTRLRGTLTCTENKNELQYFPTDFSSKALNSINIIKIAFQCIHKGVCAQ